MILHLDTHWKPLSGEEIECEKFIFSGGEPHIKINPNFDATRPVHVTHRINSFADLGLLCIAVDALRRLDAPLGKLYIPYFPAARQDRVMVAGEPLTVKVYADMINALGFDKVYVFDAHSEVTPAVINKCHVIPNFDFIQQVIAQLAKDIILVSPDGGALKKIYKVSEYMGGLPVIECSKSRDVKTGKLTGFSVYANDLQGQDCLIVDDICDGGSTFIGLAQELKNKNAGKLYLAVSHGIFSKGFAELEKHFEKIFCTDSIKEWNEVCVAQIKIVL
jgi:ribose-phosphate pyrophosphokinase